MRAEYVDHMGSDLSIVNAARVSFDKRSASDAIGGTKAHDAKLIRFLASHGHDLPFAHTAITLRMRAPIPIRTQCFKHKVGFVENEVSRRYVSTDPVIYVPAEFREAPTGGIKQGAGGAHPSSASLLAEYVTACDAAVERYTRMIAEGICPEQARFVLPQGVLTEWIWTGSLLAFARFYNLRADAHAQREVQELARMVGKIIAPRYPLAWAALVAGKGSEAKP